MIDGEFEKPRDYLVFACILIAGAALIIGAMPSISAWFAAQERQVAAVQKFRRDFIVRCHARGGEVISLGKSSVSKVCVAKDGRWLEYY